MAVCILGMHRSGTSCLAGTLQAAGLHLGEVSTDEAHNRKGNRENAAIVALHDDLLAANGGRWSDPPPFVIWSREHRARRDAIIAKLAATSPQWGFKDPRALLALDGWLEALPSLALVGVVRHPRAVVRSLNARRGVPLPRAFGLWVKYNRRLADYRRRLEFPVLCFDAPAAVLIARLRDLCARLGLNAAAADAFFEADLRHHDGAAESWADVPERARALYEELDDRP